MLNQKIKLNNKIRSFIKKERTEKNLLTSELSQAIGKTQGWLSQLENGRTVNITKVDFIALISYIRKISKEEAESYIEEFLNKEKEQNLLEPTFKSGLFKTELLKQVNHSNYKIADLEKNNSIKQGTLQELCRNNTSITPQERYNVATRVFSMLNYINPKCMDTFISMLGIPVPEDKKIFSFDYINQCYKIDSDFPVDWACHNWGDYLDFLEWEKSMEEVYENEADETDHYINEIKEENKKRLNYPVERKIKLEAKLNEAFSVLKKIIDNIDVTNYEKTINSERYLETITELLTDSDGLKIFTQLFKYPLQKLDPKDLKDICDFIDSKLEYEYLIHIKDDSQKEVMCIDDLLEDYSHLDCRYKPEIWSEIDKMIDFSCE